MSRGSDIKLQSLLSKLKSVHAIETCSKIIQLLWHNLIGKAAHNPACRVSVCSPLNVQSHCCHPKETHLRLKRCLCSVSTNQLSLTMTRGIHTCFVHPYISKWKMALPFSCLSYFRAARHIVLGPVLLNELLFQGAFFSLFCTKVLRHCFSSSCGFLWSQEFSWEYYMRHIPQQFGSCLLYIPTKLTQISVPFLKEMLYENGLWKAICGCLEQLLDVLEKIAFSSWNSAGDVSVVSRFSPSFT